MTHAPVVDDDPSTARQVVLLSAPVTDGADKQVHEALGMREIGLGLETTPARGVAPAAAALDSPSTHSERAHVLVVEDDPDMVRLIVHRLEQAGYRVSAAADGRAGLDAARLTCPDLVVLDWMMPRLTGIELSSAIRADEALAGTRILMLSARSQQSDIDRAFASGIDEFLRKPFSLRELLLGIDSLLA